MNRIYDIKPLAVFLLLFAYAALGAQGWEKTFGGNASDVSTDLIQTEDKGWLTVGSSSSFGAGDSDVYLLKTDVDGTSQRHRTLGSPGVEDRANAVFQLSDGSFLVVGTSGDLSGTNGTLWRVSSDLSSDNLLFTTTQASVTLRDVTQTTDGNFVAVGSLNEDIFLLKIDPNGAEIWSKTLVGNDLDDAFQIEAASDNDFLIAGYTHSGLSSVNALLGKYDEDGNEIWAQNYGDSVAEEQALCMTLSQNGGWLLAGFSDGVDADDEEIWLAETNATGDLLFEKNLSIAGLEKGRAITQLPNGEILITGDIRADMSSNADAILVKTDANGDLLWSKTYGGIETDVVNSILLSNENIFFSGATSSFGAGNFDVWLVKTDANGNSFSAILKGNVFGDFDLDCELDSDEVGIEDWLLKISGEKIYFTSTDELGNYELNIDTGDYVVNLVIPNPYWAPCFNDTLISVPNFNDTISLDFPVQDTVDCSFLTVDIASPFLRRCFPNTYTVSYCNTGTSMASNAEITLEFDPFLTIDSSSVNLTGLGGNVFTFNAGDLNPFDCGSFKVYTTLACDSTGSKPLLGLTHCSSARISPDTFCLAPAANWDGSSIEVAAICEGDSVSVKLTNMGDPMNAKSSFVIIEDQLIFRVIPIQLDENGDTTITIRPEGKTVRFEIEQLDGHPGNSQPSIAVEGCGALNTDSISIGYVTQFAQDDGDNFVEIDCQESIGSYDPNDKLGLPKGYKNSHLIENDTELEYRIRFQNTGTDTAFTVVIRDTLTEKLNIASVKPGTSSHPYDFEIYDGGILKFTFNNILLPDSTTNLDGSNGFVKFKVLLDDSLENGTIIYNDADIYFDFNPPVLTNQTFHQIGENFIDSVSAVRLIDFPKFNVKIAPNPFFDQTKIELIDAPHGEKHFSIYNSTGQLVREATFRGNEFLFEKDNLLSGIYYFNIKNQERLLLATGKIVLR